MIIRKSFSQIQLIVLDVDGILTDGRTRQDAHGDWRRVFSIRDSLGIRAIKKAGMHFAIVTEASGEEIRTHAGHVGIDHLFLDCGDKAVALEKMMRELDLRPEQILLMTDQPADLVLFDRIGCAVTVPTAQPALRLAAAFVTSRSGGDGAVLEVCNQVMCSNEKFKSAIKARTPAIGRRAAL